MSILDDLVTEVRTYPHNHLKLEIIEVDFPGPNINTREEGTFTLQVSNSGPLDVRDLSLIVTGKNGTQVRGPGAAAVFADEAVSNVFEFVEAHQPNRPVRMSGGAMRFKAPAMAKPEVVLIEVSVGYWNTDLNHPLLSHSDPDPDTSTTYRSQVLLRS